MVLDLQTALLIVIVLLLVWHLFLRKERTSDNVNAGGQQNILDYLLAATSGGSTNRKPNQIFTGTNQ